VIHTTPAVTDADRVVLDRVGELRSKLRFYLHEPRRWYSSLRRATLARAVQGSNSIEGYHAITGHDREVFEDEVARRAAKEILSRLPTTREEKAAFVRRGYELADRMSWDAVAREMILPALHKITAGPSVRVAQVSS